MPIQQAQHPLCGIVLFSQIAGTRLYRCRIIYFPGFSKYSAWQTMLLQESFDNHNFMPSVKAAGATGHVLITTGGDAACISSCTKKTTGKPDTLYIYITVTVTIGFICFGYKLLD